MDRRQHMALPWGGMLWAGVLALWAVAGPADRRAGGDPASARAPDAARAALRAALRRCPHRIVYESRRGDNWELIAVRADGSGPVNLTSTSGTDELYPHASPDGARICFVADEGAGRARTRSVHVMHADGTGRKLIARDARQPCWHPRGGAVAYMKGEFERFTLKDFATKGLWVHDLKTGRARPHPNRGLHHLYNVGFSPDGKWVVATVHGGMGHKHANLAIEADGDGVFPLGPVRGCRPDVSPDGRRVVWNASDQVIAVADLLLTSRPPKAANVRKLVTCAKTHEVYHADWSPDGRFVAFAHGPKGGEMVGQVAAGWNIAVADASKRNVWVPITTDGASNKEPDWLAAPRGRKR